MTSRFAGSLVGIVALVAVPAKVRSDGFDWVGKVAVDAEGLRSDDAKQRVEAVHLLAMDYPGWSQPYLLKALTDSDRTVRLEAGKALGAAGSSAAVPMMVDWLADADAHVRSTATDALGDIGGAAATQALMRSLGDSDPAVRQSAVKSLGKLGLRGSPGVVVALLPRLDDDKADVRRETVDQLEQLGDRRAVIPLVSRFADTSREVAKSAARAVGKLGDISAAPALIRIMRDPDENLRRVAVQSLGQLRAVDAIDVLIEQLRSVGSDAFHSGVAYALGRIATATNAGNAGEEAMRALVEDLANSKTRAAAIEGLRIAGPAAIPALVARLSRRSSSDVSTLTAAVTLLSETGDARTTEPLVAELERGRVATPLVLKALGRTRDSRALVPVLGAVSSPDAAIRLAAMQALRPLLGGDARAGDVLIERLDDDDVQVRALAAEYLGVLNVRAATPKLAALARAEVPLRLRIAAIDALGEIAAVRNHRPAPADTAISKVLVDILRDGPRDLRAATSTALSYIADASALPSLIALARIDRSATRHEIVRAIGGTLRSQTDPAGRMLLRDLARDPSVRVAIAAIGGLAAANDRRDAPYLRSLLDHAVADRQRAAAWALGELHDADAITPLSNALSFPDDRLAGAAAWALGEVVTAAPTKVRGGALSALADRWLYVAHHGGWSAAIDSVAALGRALWAQPRETRTLLPSQRRALDSLTLHKSRLVRINAAFALSSLAGDATAADALAQLLRDDASPRVRTAAAVGLGRLGGGAGRLALETSAKGDADPDVVAAAKDALTGSAATAPARTEWRTFYIVDANGARVTYAPYFIHAPDGIVWAAYTDARGELTSEHIPPGTAAIHVWPASRESEY